MLSPPAVVEVVKVSRFASVEDGRVAEGEGAVGTVVEAGRVDGTCLRRTVELELVVGGDVAYSVLGVGDHSVLKLRDEDALPRTGLSALLL